MCVPTGTVWCKWPKASLGPRGDRAGRRGARLPTGPRAVGAYLDTACLAGPCFASSCGNALYVPLKSFAVYSFGHNIHICEVYQLQETQLSSRPQLNAGLSGRGMHAIQSLPARPKALLGSAKPAGRGQITALGHVTARGFLACARNACQSCLFVICPLY